MPLISGIADHTSSLMMVFLLLTFFLFSQRPPLCLLQCFIELNSIGNQQTMAHKPNLIHCVLFLFFNKVLVFWSFVLEHSHTQTFPYGL